jgi:pimeloyl-ACP methyl ester carboxylesterase
LATVAESDEYLDEEESRDGLFMNSSKSRSVITPIRGLGNSSTLVLFLPGLSGNLSQWKLVIPQIEDMPVDLAYGLPILPNPALSHGKPTVTAIARLTASELQRGKWKEVIIVSHSVGAFVALGIARILPEIVKEVILVNGGLAGVAQFLDHPAHELVTMPRTSLGALRLFVLVATPMPPAAKKAIAKSKKASCFVLRGLVSDAALESTEQRRILMDESATPRVLKSLWDNRHHWQEFKGYAGEIRSKVLFLAGSRDSIGGEPGTQEMMALLPDAEMQVLPGVGHAAPLETTGAVAKAIRKAVEEAVPGHLVRSTAINEMAR